MNSVVYLLRRADIYYLLRRAIQTNLPWRPTENAGFDETPGGGGGEMQRASTVAGVFLKHLCCLNETQSNTVLFYGAC